MNKPNLKPEYRLKLCEKTHFYNLFRILTAFGWLAVNRCQLLFFTDIKQCLGAI